MDYFKKLGKKALLRVLQEFRNILESLHKETVNLKEENQRLKDEINRLKGEKGKPSIKPNIKSNDESEAEESADDKIEKKNWKKSCKKEKIEITRKERLTVDKAKLPSDAEYKGTRSVVIQDIKIKNDNIEFEIERYYSKSEQKMFEGELPKEYHGSEFGPGIISFILLFHYQGRMAQKLLHTILTGIGVIISEGEVSLIISERSNDFSNEKEKAREAAIAKQDYQQIDDTGARLRGQNYFTIATCNDYFTSYETVPSKNRLSALQALAGGKDLLFLIDDVAVKYIQNKLPGKAIWRHFDELKSNRVLNSEELLRDILKNPEVSRYGEYTIKYIKEALAIAAYKSNYLGESVNKLVCDDAGQFKGLTEYLQLCWVHEARHYKKIEPYIDEHAEILDDFMDKFWNYYEKLKYYKINPTIRLKKKLLKEFDDIFTANTSFYDLDRIIKETKKKKDNLLLVLEFPEVPIHNNGCELDIREKVVQRKIRYCHRSPAGARASDIFLSLMATCRKNKIGFYHYLQDRIYKTFNVPPLYEIIQNGYTHSF